MAKVRGHIGRREVVAGGLSLVGSGVLSAAATAAQDWASKRVLVAYYSRTGHTRTVAEMVSRHTGGTLVEIETVEPYPENYDALVSQNVREQQANFLPPLRASVENIADFDEVFIGSPLWNVRLTPPVRSFIASHDLSRPTVAPFVTYIVSQLGRAHRDIAELAPQANVVPGLAVLGEDADTADERVEEWVAGLPLG